MRRSVRQAVVGAVELDHLRGLVDCASVWRPTPTSIARVGIRHGVEVEVYQVLSLVWQRVAKELER